MLLPSALLVFLCSAVSASYKSSANWNIFTFTQEWPVAVCVNGEEEHHTCKIPSDIHSWGIHGLWPTQSGTEGPTSCNETWNFNATALQDLIPQLKIEWPNLYTDTAMTSFWEHEWSKHGTCATSLPATADQHKYFAKALAVKSRFDAGKLFSNQGIHPDRTAIYKIQDVEEALKRELSVNALVMCAYDQKTKQHIMYELEICLNKNFDPIDCYPDSDANGSGKRYSHHHKYYHKPTSNCPESKGFIYPPIPDTYTAKSNSGNVGDTLLPKLRSVVSGGAFSRDQSLLFKDLQYYLNKRRTGEEIYVSYMEEKRVK